VPACKKQPVGESGERDSVSVWANPQGKCFMSVPQHCPKGASCNPPPPPEVDCPPALRDASAPAAITRRPAGKSDWLRVLPRLSLNRGRQGATCTYVPEYFCAPEGKKVECTKQPTNVDVKCAFVTEPGVPQDGGIAVPPGHFTLETFVFKDVNATCHRAPAMECAMRGCDKVEDEVVPCP